MVLCGKLLISVLRKSWLWRRISMLSRTQQTPREPSVRSFSCRSWLGTRTSFASKMWWGLKTIEISTWYSTLWTLICTLLSGPTSWKTSTSSTLFTSAWNVSSTCTRPTYSIEIWSHPTCSLILSATSRSLTLVLPAPSIKKLISSLCSPTTWPLDGTVHPRFSSVQTNILREWICGPWVASWLNSC